MKTSRYELRKELVPRHGARKEGRSIKIIAAGHLGADQSIKWPIAQMWKTRVVWKS